MKQIEKGLVQNKVSLRFIGVMTIIAFVVNTLYVGVLFATTPDSMASESTTTESNRPATVAAKPQTQVDASAHESEDAKMSEPETAHVIDQSRGSSPATPVSQPEQPSNWQPTSPLPSNAPVKVEEKVTIENKKKPSLPAVSTPSEKEDLREKGVELNLLGLKVGLFR